MRLCGLYEFQGGPWTLRLQAVGGVFQRLAGSEAGAVDSAGETSSRLDGLRGAAPMETSHCLTLQISRSGNRSDGGASELSFRGVGLCLGLGKYGAQLVGGGR